MDRRICLDDYRKNVSFISQIRARFTESSTFYKVIKTYNPIVDYVKEIDKNYIYELYNIISAPNTARVFKFLSKEPKRSKDFMEMRQL